VAQAAIASEVWDPTLVSRAQRYEREALATLCDRSLDALYRVCLALTGEAAEAESLAATALQKALDGLPSFEGDSPAFHVWLLRLAASSASRRRPAGEGVRGALTRLSNFDYELVALRVLGEIGVDHLAPALNAEPASLRAWLVSALREVDGRSGTGWGHDLRAFDSSLSDVIGGADPEQVPSHGSAPADSETLLRVVAGIRGLVGDPMPAATATRLRTHLLAAAAERRALWVYRHHSTATVPGIEKRRYPSRTGTVIALSIAAVLAVVVGAVLAVLSSFASPDSGLYPLKLTGESALVNLNLDPVNRAQLEIKLAQTRQREAEDMASRGSAPAAKPRGTQHVEARRGGPSMPAVSMSAASVQPARRARPWPARRPGWPRRVLSPGCDQAGAPLSASWSNIDRISGAGARQRVRKVSTMARQIRIRIGILSTSGSGPGLHPGTANVLHLCRIGVTARHAQSGTAQNLSPHLGTPDGCSGNGRSDELDQVANEYRPRPTPRS
jgi:hypothetical protein